MILQGASLVIITHQKDCYRISLMTFEVSCKAFHYRPYLFHSSSISALTEPAADFLWFTSSWKWWKHFAQLHTSLPIPYCLLNQIIYFVLLWKCSHSDCILMLMIFCDKILYNFTVSDTNHSSMQELTWWSFNIHDSQSTGLGFQPVGICSKWREMTKSTWDIAQIPNMVAKHLKKCGSSPTPVKKKPKQPTNHVRDSPNDSWI